MSAVAAVTPIRPRDSAPEPVWLSPEQVCERVPGMTVERLSQLRKKRLGPTYYKPTLKTVVYDAAEIDAWVTSTRETTRESQS